MTTVIAIVEGIEFSRLRELTQKQSLPFLGEDVRQGKHWFLDSGLVPYEPTNLASAFSGRIPGEHGCFSYWSLRDEVGQKPRILTSDDVKVPLLWHWPEMSGVKFAVVNVQLTHPPQPLEGYMLSYLMNQTLRYSYPDDLVHHLKKRQLPYGHDVSAFYRGEQREEFDRRVTTIAEYQLKTALVLGLEVDILIINMTLADRLSHFFWHEFALAEEYPQEFRMRCPLVEKAYVFLDWALAALDQMAGSDPMLVFSEMGFGELDEFISLDKILQEGGLQSPDLYSVEDRKKTVAREAVQGSHGILTAPEAGENAVDEVISCLLEARDDLGRPVVKSVKRREEIYQGSYVDLAPDLVIEPADLARPPMGDPRWASHVIRHNQTGWHRDRGFALARRAKPEAAYGRKLNLESIAPTVAALAGRAAPKECQEASFLSCD